MASLEHMMYQETVSSSSTKYIHVEILMQNLLMGSYGQTETRFTRQFASKQWKTKKHLHDVYDSLGFRSHARNRFEINDDYWTVSQHVNGGYFSAIVTSSGHFGTTIYYLVPYWHDSHLGDLGHFPNWASQFPLPSSYNSPSTSSPFCYMWSWLMTTLNCFEWPFLFLNSFQSL